MGYESYIVQADGYTEHLDAAAATLELLSSDRDGTSNGFDMCIDSARDFRLRAAIASIWNDHLGPLMSAAQNQAGNGTAAAREVLRAILIADEIAATHAANPEDPMLNTGSDPGIVAAEEKAATAADGADDWDPSWQSIPDDERKG